jgi:uncharacterized protein (DUF486 family)
MNPILISISLLVISNVFMTFAWYAHLKELNSAPWFVAAIISWLVASLEYMFQVPANRIGYAVFSVGQLKYFYTFRCFLFKRTIKTGLFMGWSLHDRGRVFYV